MINNIAKIVGFDYDLYHSPDGTYGEEDAVNGLIGEIYHKVNDSHMLFSTFNFVNAYNL